VCFCVIGAGCGIHQGHKVAETPGVVHHTQNDKERTLKQQQQPLMTFHQTDT